MSASTLWQRHLHSTLLGLVVGHLWRTPLPSDEALWPYVVVSGLSAASIAWSFVDQWRAINARLQALRAYREA